MTDRRDPAYRQASDWAKLKGQVRDLLEGQLEFVEIYLQGRLRHVDDFERFVGLNAVRKESGRIDWMLLEQRLAQLLRDRPELGL